MRRGFLLAFVLLSTALFAADYTALDRYVQTPDPSYRYDLVNSASALGVTAYVLDMVSQNWLTAAEVNRTEWRHWLVIYRPDKISTSTALLVIDGGSNGGPAPLPDLLTAALAAETSAVVVDLQMVPNQPLRFAGDDRDRTEDALIAFTWDRFLRTGDDRWPARLPMTKAAVRAMDTVTDFLASSRGGNVRVDRFVVAGGSKRGWTTWTTAAVDRRVVAIAPMSIDVLNVESSFIHHWRAYGFWSPAIQDYVDMGLMNWLGTQQYHALMEIEDPYEYRHRFTMPKYIISSSGDQFFLPDSSQFYFDRLPGEKYLRYVPNTDHALAPDVIVGLLSWFQSIVTGTPRPRFSWTSDRAAGIIRLETLDPPSQVMLWQATNPAARDFRLMTIGTAWRSSAVNGEHGIYVASVPKPDLGWTAFFLELTYPNSIFTTDVVVTPNLYPFPPPPTMNSPYSARPRRP
jgi:PhoPQ-activated pathogenicity-related protein